MNRGIIMEKITIRSPRSLSFGPGSLGLFADDFRQLGYKRLFIITLPFLKEKLDPIFQSFLSLGIHVEIYDLINNEPTYNNFKEILNIARKFKADAITGIGGGSVMDTAKLLAALLYSDQSIDDVSGINRLRGRSTWMACLPTTSGTGSEVSPNAIFLDESDGEKKGVISPFLVPDAAYVDPELTIGVPPAVTAFTGIDAFTHCLEAFVNRFSHPVVDQYAIKGIELIFQSLATSFENGEDLEARTNVALGSLYGGMCLGPVNTAAVHALAYPLGSKFKVPHGLSNALLLPYVMEFNLPAAVRKYARVARTIGVEDLGTDEEQAREGINRIRQLLKAIDIPGKLSQINIPGKELEGMALSAIKVQRLLKNNVRDMDIEDILAVYKSAY